MSSFLTRIINGDRGVLRCLFKRKILILASALFSIAVQAQTNAQLDIVSQFKTCSNDSDFIMKNSQKRGAKFEKRWIDGRGNDYYHIDSLVFQGNMGDVVGPYKDSTCYVWYKIVSTDSSMKIKAGHILIKTMFDYAKYNEKSKKNALFVLDQALKGSNYDALCKKYSEDGSATNFEGSLGWIFYGYMLKEIDDAMFSHKKGDIFMVQSAFGYHIMKIFENPVKGRRMVFAVPLYLKQQP